MGMIDSSILAASQVGQRVPSHTWEWFLPCVGGFILFVAVVALAAHIARTREDRREGRARPRRERSTV